MRLMYNAMDLPLTCKIDETWEYIHDIPDSEDPYMLH